MTRFFELAVGWESCATHAGDTGVPNPIDEIGRRVPGGIGDGVQHGRFVQTVDLQRKARRKARRKACRKAGNLTRRGCDGRTQRDVRYPAGCGCVTRHVAIRQALMSQHTGTDAHARPVVGMQFDVQTLWHMDGLDGAGPDSLGGVEMRSATEIERRRLEFQGGCGVRHRLSQRKVSSGSTGRMSMQSTGQGARHNSQPVQ